MSGRGAYYKAKYGGGRSSSRGGGGSRGRGGGGRHNAWSGDESRGGAHGGGSIEPRDSAAGEEDNNYDDEALSLSAAVFDAATGEARVPYSGDARPVSELRRTLERLEGAGYGAYRDIERTAWTCMDGEGLLVIDRVQRDAYAPPSRVRIAVTGRKARLGLAAWGGGASSPAHDDGSSNSPVLVFPPPHDSSSSSKNNKAARIAAADWAARRFFEAARAAGDDSRTETGGWGGKKGGELRIAVPSQFVLERSSCFVSRSGGVELRLTAALPARGRTIEGRWAARVLCDRALSLAEAALCCSSRQDAEALERHAACVVEQRYVRSQLADAGLCCFVAQGSVLPRRAGNDDRPMEGGLPWSVADCGKLVKTLRRLDGSPLVGLGFPARAVTLVCGGGFHGKSTLLQALQVGCYDKIPGDGREPAVAVETVAKIRAEDGRAVSAVDVSAFLGHLPGRQQGSAVQAATFSTSDASGSTSQAASIVEALEVGCEALLFDEDTCATNFMIRDDRMRALVADDKEPITPLVDRIRHLAVAEGTASVLVLGGTGDYFSVADAVIVMDAFQPRDATDRAKAIVAATTTTTQARADAGAPPAGPGSSYFKRRAPRTPFEPLGRCATRALRLFQYGDNNDVDLKALEQLVELGQTSAICAAVATLARRASGRSSPSSPALADILADLDKALDTTGLDVLAPAHGGLAGDLARPRTLEIAAAINRVRSLRFNQLPGR